MGMVPMVTLPYYLICLSSPAKDLLEKNHTQKVKESTFTEKNEEQQTTRERFFSFYRNKGLISLIKEKRQ